MRKLTIGFLKYGIPASRPLIALFNCFLSPATDVLDQVQVVMWILLQAFAYDQSQTLGTFLWVYSNRDVQQFSDH